MGGFASQFDLISSEYGWSDQQIGELPFMRFQQIVSAISLRRANKVREENYRFSWLARNLSQFVAAGYMVEGENPAIQQASTLAFDKVEREMLAHQAAIQESQPTKVHAPVEPVRGSFEKLMGLMDQKKD